MATRRQYEAVARRFEDFSVGESYWAESSPTYEQLTQAVKAWFASLDLKAPATIATYRSAVTRYASAAGYEIRCSELVATPDRDRGNTRQVENLSDSQLRAMRREAGESPAMRSALELAIAGLSIEQIATVTSGDLSASPGQSVGMVSLIDGREIELFDQIGVRWLMGEGAATLPVRASLSEATIRKRLARLVYRVTRKQGGLRELRMTGVRRAISIGIRRRRIADSLDQALRDRWLDFHRNASKRPETGYDPIPADPARGRAIAAMSEEEFDRMLEGLGEAA